jgi:hypothetical protein
VYFGTPKFRSKHNPKLAGKAATHTNLALAVAAHAPSQQATMAARLVSVSVPHLLLLLVIVLILAGSRVALQSMVLLHELALSRQHIQATKRAPPASDKPSRRACGQPNAP